MAGSEGRTPDCAGIDFGHRWVLVTDEHGGIAAKAKCGLVRALLLDIEYLFLFMG